VLPEQLEPADRLEIRDKVESKVLKELLERLDRVERRVLRAARVDQGRKAVKEILEPLAHQDRLDSKA